MKTLANINKQIIFICFNKFKTWSDQNAPFGIFNELAHISFLVFELCGLKFNIIYFFPI